MKIETLWILHTIRIKGSEIAVESLPFAHYDIVKARLTGRLADLYKKGIHTALDKTTPEQKIVKEEHHRLKLKNGLVYDIKLAKTTIAYDDFLLDDEF